MSGSSTSQDDALRKMTKLVNSLMARGDCGPFREPVDWRGLELYDYPKIIKRMMDLGTVKRKLERGQYRVASDTAEDIRLVWSNCKTYNMEGSDFYLLAESFSRKFEDRYKKIRAEFDTGESGSGKSGGTSSSKLGEKGGPPSLDMKTALAASIFQLSGTALGHVMQVIDLRCPKALERPNGSIGGNDGGGGGAGAGPGGADDADADADTAAVGCTEVEINVDAIDGRTFAELDRYVREKVSDRPTGSSGNADGYSEGSSPPSKKRRR